MNPLRLSIRFPTTDSPEDLEPAIGVFHRFIQRGLVEGSILDVADYRHIPGGPGVLLVGHDVDYGLSQDAFTVVRKRSAEDPAATQLRDSLRMGFGALEAIAEDGEIKVAVDRGRCTVAVHDRRLGDREDVAQALLAEVEPVLASLYGAEASVSVVAGDDPRQPPQVEVQADPASAERLLEELGGSQAPLQSPWDIRPEELARLRDNGSQFLLLDVREDSEYEKVNLGGTHVPLATLGDRLGEFDPDAHIVVHCRAGRRGAKAVTQLREAGFTNAFNVNGGLMGWIDRIDPSLPRY